MHQLPFGYSTRDLRHQQIEACHRSVSRYLSRPPSKSVPPLCLQSVFGSLQSVPLHPCALAGSLFRHDGSPANPLLFGQFTCLFLDLFLRRNQRQQADSLKACYEVGTICEAAGVIFIAENGEGAGVRLRKERPDASKRPDQFTTVNVCPSGLRPGLQVNLGDDLHPDSTCAWLL